MEWKTRNINLLELSNHCSIENDSVWTVLFKHWGCWVTDKSSNMTLMPTALDA